MGWGHVVFDEAKHRRGAGGKFARKSVDVSGRSNTGVRGDAAFRPRPTASARRAMKEAAPSAWRSAKALYDRRDAGGKLSWREEQSISWASPKRALEQMAKTGDALVPRGEASARIRGMTRAESRQAVGRLGNRDLIERNRRTNRVEARRTGRTLDPAGSKTSFASRPIRGSGMRQPPKPSSAPAYTPQQLALATPARLREIAASLGLTVPPRAGHRILTDLILGVRR